MNPYTNAPVRDWVRAFLDGYFSDNVKRVLVFGINPGRFGAGITGVTFTDPVALAENCGIENDLPRRRELSSVFIYKVIERYGGPREFYRRFFLTAISLLGFTRNGKNLNYYDDPALIRAVTPFITNTIEQQIALGAWCDRAVVLGAGENLRFVQQLNDRHRFFRKIDALCQALSNPLRYDRRIVTRRSVRNGRHCLGHLASHPRQDSLEPSGFS